MLRREFLLQAGATGLLAAADVDVSTSAWKARWIFPAGAPPNAYGVYHFRRTFTLDRVPAAFKLHVSGDSRYELFLNGVRISRGPARGDLNHWRYETVDAAAHAVQGRNVLAAVVWNDTPYAAVCQWSNRTAFLLQAGDTEFETVNTGKGWLCAADPAYAPIPLPGNQRDEIAPGYYAIGPMERFDSSKYLWGWEQPSFDDSTWQPAEVGPNASPRDQTDAPSRWMLVARNIPPMEDTPIRLARVRKAEGVQPPSSFPSQRTAITIPANTKATLLLDQDHLTTAFLELEVNGGQGAEIHVRYAEALFQRLRPRATKGNRDEVEGKEFRGYGDVYTADGQHRVYRPLYWRTWRYMQLTVETKAQPLVIEDVRGVFTSYPFAVKAKLDTGVPFHQKMLDIGWRTARLCAHETYMDCPYYEQLQYVGDTRIQAMVTLYMTGDPRLVRNAIEIIDSSRTAEGATLSRAPSVLQQYIPPFSLWWVGMVHDYWWYVDEPTFVRRMLNGVRSVVGWYTSFLRPDGLLGAMPWWNYVDWVATWRGGRPPSEPDVMPATIQLQLLLALRWAEELEAALGSRALAGQHKETAARLHAAIQAKFHDAQRGLYSEDLAHKHFSQHANVLAVLADLPATPAAARELMLKVEPDKSLYKCSVYFRYYLDRAMVKAGLGDRYLDRLGTWEFMVKEGLTTWAETDSGETRSDCHAWGSSPNIEFFRTVLGVDSAAPGFSKVRLAPNLGKLTKASGVVPHPKGVIEVSVERVGAGYRWTAKVPAGVQVLGPPQA
ncbi:alpha-L-rhamnosidase C-terminal domain-containing protein [uncultured Paludibaculum sp.]|uniref:alpha-L-rhamnosidase-related protein n=1 Tax=uncultured Paludibaculum sp. TaxID=1765020 RepID=UPI002AAA6321|nr:alpha-L-rhamnosidase C-terminal domain-containing protein [uncultured Paludibaculum sp.]